MNKIHTKPHWSFWVICIVALIWNLMGSINFFMQMNPDTVAGYSDAAQSLIASRPLWATAGFAIAVFGGVVGRHLGTGTWGRLCFYAFFPLSNNSISLSIFSLRLDKRLTAF